MLPSHLKGLYEAYSEVYVEKIDAIDDDIVIEEIVEELIGECVEFGYTLDEAAYAVEEAAIEYLMELNPYAPAGSKEARAYQKSTTSTKRGEARKAAVQGAVQRVRATASGVKAAAGIAGSIAKDEARRAGRAATHAVSSAVQKKKAQVKSGVKGLLKKGLSAVAGGAGAVAQKARKVGAAAGKAADRLGEEVSGDNWDLVLEFLVTEGHADTNEEALYVMTQLDEDTIQGIIEAVLDEKLRERPRGLPYGPVGKGFRELTVPQRSAMLKRGKEHTRAAMRSGEEYSGSHAKSSAIDSALRSKRLGGRG